MHSPQTLRRGNTRFSTSATDQPASASRMAAVEPATPPPITSASKRLLIAPRDEEMAERAGRVLGQRPLVCRRGSPRGADLVVAKPGDHTHDRIVTRDVVAADQAEQP